MGVKTVFGSGTSDEQGTVAEYLGSGIWDPGVALGDRETLMETSPLSGAGRDATMQIPSPLKLPIRAT